ncbi:hypothetical protein NQ317_004365 [Molorchus minor]|uniref:Uncharacterized protein n=1 Tax=Molorchus minor TaxID=1323400 RepID=A0ABQ9ITT9_9CUCU|nr:hypothetical protein NQ317_004365 [Molorchus minor]
MKVLTSEINSYLVTRSEDSDLVINRYLQAFSVTTDVSIFDPEPNVGANFFFGLYQLFSKTEPHSQMAWYCVDVLTNACRNSSARRALIKTYNFIPYLARLLSDHLSVVKNKKLLKLMQDLSCGIKISWQIPHLPHLLKTLTKWVESQDDEIVCLSLDYMHADIPKGIIGKIVEPTFLSIFEAFKDNDFILLRQIVDFFLDVIGHSKHIHILKEYKQYGQQIEMLLQLIENNISKNPSDPESSTKDNNNPECKLAINWVNSEWVSYQALVVLTKITERARENDNSTEISNMLMAALPSFMFILRSNAAFSNMECCRRLGALLQLFRAMLQNGNFRAHTLQSLKIESVKEVFTSLQSDDLQLDSLPYFKSENGSATSTDAAHTYLYGLGLINDLVQYDAHYLDLQGTLMENRKVHMIIAQALYGGTTEVRSLALEICWHPSLPIGKVATAMGVLQPIFANTSQGPHRSPLMTQDVVELPTLSFNQMERLDDTLHQMKTLIKDSNVGNIATHQVMELYEYKLSTLAYAEKSALYSIEAATERCTQLQHRLAQVMAEYNKLHQLLFHTEKCLDQTRKSKEEVQAMYTQEQNQRLAIKGQNKVLDSQLKNKEKALAECLDELEGCHKNIKDLSETTEKLKEQLSKKEQFVNKLVENGNKLEKHLQKTEDLLKKLTWTIKNLNTQIVNLEETLSKTELKLAHTTEQLQATRSIIQTITKVANSQVPAME